MNATSFLKDVELYFGQKFTDEEMFLSTQYFSNHIEPEVYEEAVYNFMRFDRRPDFKQLRALVFEASLVTQIRRILH